MEIISITDSIWFMLLFIFVLGYLNRIYRSKKYPEKYKPVAIWEKLGVVWVILVISIILYIAFFY